MCNKIYRLFALKRRLYSFQNCFATAKNTVVYKLFKYFLKNALKNLWKMNNVHYKSLKNKIIKLLSNNYEIIC